MSLTKKWVVLHPEKIDRGKSEQEIINLLLKNRGVDENSFLLLKSPDQLDSNLARIDSSALKKAVSLINQAREEKKKIIIYGDYDADGLSATAILWQPLWQQGFDVLPYIPDRIKDGYGINPRTIKKLKTKYPDLGLIITVDNGIVAHQAVESARSLGVKVIITDHHLLPPTLPKAETIIHSSQLAGSGVAWFLAREFGYQDLDLVALGTIADLLPLRGINHQLVKFGLRELSQTKRIGLKSLMKKAGILDKEISSWDVSFILAPRLNAAGRLAQAVDGLRLLCTNNPQQAEKLASQLETINDQRQRLMNQSFEDAQMKVSDSPGKIILAADESYHQGIIGLVAGKLVEKFYRPAIVVWRGENYSKGSARSIAGCNIVELIRKAESFLVDLGGHPMAAGFTLKTKDIEKFFQRIEEVAEEMIQPEILTPQLQIDFAIDFSLLTKDFYRLIQTLAPFGFGNPAPTFLLPNVRVVNLRTMGRENQHLRLWLDDPQTPLVERLVAEAVGFGWGDWGDKLLAGDLIDLVFTLDLNLWQGQERLQLKIKDFRLINSE